MRAVAVLGLVTIPLNYVLLKRLLAIVETVRAGDPFVAANALRLQAIAWVMCFSTLEAICGALSCQPGDLLRFESEQAVAG